MRWVSKTKVHTRSTGPPALCGKESKVQYSIKATARNGDVGERVGREVGPAVAEQRLGTAHEVAEAVEARALGARLEALVERARLAEVERVEVRLHF